MMLARLYLVYFLLFFASSISFANEAHWNCQQDKKTKEWVCVGSADSARPKADNARASTGQPTQTVPETQARPAPAVTGATPESSPDSSKDAAAGITPAFKSAQPNTAETLEKEQPVIEKPKLEEKAADAEVKEEVAEKTTAPVENPVSDKTINTPSISEAPPLPASEKPVAAASNRPSSVAPASAGGNPRGWNCDTKGADGNWNCQLVGADPKGEARVIEPADQGISLLDPAFDNTQEQIFYSLRDRFKNNPWGNCTIQLGTQKYYFPDKNQRDKADIDMNSNAAEIYDNEIGNYQGNVEMKRADQLASSNSANYDAVSETLDLHGNVFYSEDEIALHTDTATLKLASDEARLRKTLFISPTTPLRGRANAVYRDSKTLSRYKDVAYTSCQPGNQDWVVHATDLKMNKQSGYGSAKNAWVEFKGVPVFYSPYLSFPMDDRRMTGFLAPSFGNTQTGGFNFSTPFYWNIAPNYDATIRPRYYTKRGVMLAGDFRYLTKKSKGLVSAEYMPNDDVREKPRYLATAKNTTRFTNNISSNVDLNIVSDREYFAELGNALSFPNFSHIRSFADASYVDEGVSLVGRLESFQTIDPQLRGRLRPYRRLPQLNFNLNHSFASLPADTGLESEYVYFQHDDSALPDGHRFNAKPYVSFPLKTASAFVTPKLSLQYTQYLLNNQKVGTPDSIDRFVPIASVDSGLFFEKDLNLGGTSLLHTLEPRLFYLYIPKVNQDNIPIFDTSLYDFQYDSLFRENRFSGSDRVQDANQITAALTSRLVDSATGLERLRFSVGDTIHFQDREVTAPDVRVGAVFLESPVQNSTFSPVVAELSSQINKHVSIDTGLQWDPDLNEIIRGKAYFHFVNDPGEIFNVGYLYRKNNLIRDSLSSLSDQEVIDTFGFTTVDQVNSLRKNGQVLRGNDIIQTDVSFRWPVYDDWFAIGRWQYSFLLRQTQESFFGFEKENCCWRFRVIGRRYVNNSLTGLNAVPGRPASSDSQTGIFFQIEFKGLTGIGNAGDIGDFFTQSIYGYQKKDY